jgi:hypothetical protein
MIEHLILHIGTHKTGTTSIQHRLWHSYDLLAANGILYPRSGVIWMGQHRLPWAIGYDHPARDPAHKAEDIAEAILNEAKQKNCATIVLSSEDFRLLDDAGIARLAELIPAERVTLFLGVRRQDGYLISQYKQSVQSYHILFTGDVNGFFKTKLREHELDYAHTVDRWQAAFPQAAAIIRVMEKGHFEAGGPAGTFWNALELPVDGDGKPVNEHKENPSLSDIGTLVMADINARHRTTLKVRQGLMFQMLEFDQGWKAETELLGPENRKALIDRYAASNKRLAGLMGLNDANTPFGKAIPEKNRTGQPELEKLKGHYLRELALFQSGKLIARN